MANHNIRNESTGWPSAERFAGVIDLHFLPPVAEIDGARIRHLTGDDAIPEATNVILQAFEAVVGERSFDVGFCIGNENGVSPIGIAVIDRLTREAPGAPIHVVPVVHGEIAWDIVLRHLRSFSGRVLLFRFPDSDVYDAGAAPKYYSKHIRVFGPDGSLMTRLTSTQRREIQRRKAAILNRPPPPKFYPVTEVELEDSPWIFRIATPAGKVIRAAVWDGRRDYAHEIPEGILKWVGGEKIAVVQVDSPVGINRRSSLDLTHNLSKDFDGIVHWARDTETFQSILKSFVRLDLDSVGPPELPAGWNPEVVIFAANETVG